MNVTVSSIGAFSAIFILMCGRNLTNPVEYTLVEDEESRQIQLNCETSVEEHQLRPDTTYTLVKTYSNPEVHDVCG